MKFYQHNKIVMAGGSGRSYFIREIRDEFNNLIKYVYLDQTPIDKTSPCYNEYEIFRRELNPRPSRYYDYTMYV